MGPNPEEAAAPSLDPLPTRGGEQVGWAAASGEVEIRFLGRGAPERGAGELSSPFVPRRLACAWLRQVHSATVIEAGEGDCGEGDALSTARAGLGLMVATADCVPVLLAGGGRVAAVHAGWRGIVAGVVPAALATFRAVREVEVWIGPAIGPCCYEVGEEVAAAVVASSRSSVALPGRRGRPHLDLQEAVAAQLAAAGVTRLVRLARCTACHPAELHSHRRDGARAGRNLALIWRR